MSQPAPAKPASTPPKTKHRVFVVEDHPLMRRSIVEALEREPDLTVCGQADDAPEALAAILSLQPDVVLTDMKLKSSNGLDLIKRLRVQLPAVPIVASTMFDLNRTEQLARAAGASDFVSKQAGPEQLIGVIHGVLRDGGNRVP